MSLASPPVATQLPAASDRTTDANLPNARVALVDALTAAGCNATKTPPDSPTQGAAWPQWVITNRTGHIANPSRHTFDCYVVLNSADGPTTVDYGDQVAALVLPYLESAGSVQSVEPVLITFGDQTSMPGIRFRVLTRA